MDKREVDRLFTLLAAFFPNAKQGKDPNVRLAWGLALEDAPYETAKGAVIAYAKTSKFFPDLSDLGLGPPEGAKRPRETEESRYGAVVRAYIDAKRAAAAGGCDMAAWKEQNIRRFPPPPPGGLK